MTTLREIARQAGVSVYTVSKVLSDEAVTARISPQRAAAVREIATKLNFRPNGMARAIRQGRTRQIGVLVPNNPGNPFTHPLAYETILGINEGLQPTSHLLVMVRIGDIRRELADQSRVFREHLLDGMIILDSMPADVEQQVEGIMPHCVWCDSNVWHDYGCIRRDEHLAGQLAGAAAVTLGYGQVVMMTYPPPYRVHFSATERFEGVRSKVEPAGRSLEVVMEPAVGNAAERGSLAACLHDDLVIICNSIYQAQAVRSIGEEAGKIAGRDFGLICCDDAHQMDRLWPGLTRVSFDRYEMGLKAAAMMLDVLSRSLVACPSVRLPAKLILGATTRPRNSVDRTEADQQ